jgi:hypothetical protein
LRVLAIDRTRRASSVGSDMLWRTCFSTLAMESSYTKPHHNASTANFEPGLSCRLHRRRHLLHLGLIPDVHLS